MLEVKSFTFNPFSENTYLLYDETGEAVIVDPGCYDKNEQVELDEFISENQLKPTLLLNTHCHIDHVLGNAHVKAKYKVPLWIHKHEEQILRAVSSYASNYGFPNYQQSQADLFIKEGKEIKFGTTLLQSLFVPGHAPGHLVFYHKESKTCIGGDTLFQESIGRTDLPGGDHETLLRAIKTELFQLPDDVIVYPGHGPTTTIGFEKQHNPFVGLNARF